MSPKKKVAKTFEAAMERLDEIVHLLETGNLPLEEALNIFEEGVGQSKFCAAKLDEIEKKISLLMEDATGRVTEKPFEVESDKNETGSDVI